MTTIKHQNFDSNINDNGAPDFAPSAGTFVPDSDIAYRIVMEASGARAATPETPAYTDDTAFNAFYGSTNGVVVEGYDGGGVYGYYVAPKTGSDIGFVFDHGTATSIVDANASTIVVGDSNSGQYQAGFIVTNSGAQYFIDDDGTFSNLDISLNQFNVDAINSSGAVAGDFVTGTGGVMGFVYEDGVTSLISDPNNGSEQPGYGTVVRGITDTGAVFGYYGNSAGEIVGFIESGGVYTDIAAPGGYNTYITGMNDEGQAIGFYDDSNGGDAQSFVESGGSFTALDDPNAVGHTSLIGIDDSGTVFGDYHDIDNSQVFFITDDALCYVRGTRIRTAGGDVAVEDLRIGDRVATRSGGHRRVKWIGLQSYDPRFLARNPAKLPVRIAAGALGDGVPARELLVSPGHSILLDGTLVLASALVNGITVTQTCAADLRGRVEYFNIDLNSHDCLLAEGAWAESFADGPGLRDQFHNAAGFYALYPDYAAPEEIRLCAPRPERGPALAAALRPVVARAGAGLRVGRLEGVIDVMTASRLEGWAIDTEHPELPVLLDIVLDEAVIATALACDFRADLLQARKGRGRCAFFVTLPAPLPAGRLHTLRIRRAADGAELAVSEGLRAAA